MKKQNQVAALFNAGLAKREDTELDEVNYSLACDLHTKFPQVRIRFKEAKEAEGKLAQKYFRLCEALREPGEGVKLNGKEITLLLLSLGYRKQRVTEFRRVVEVSDDVWEQYKKNVIGFKAVLSIARGSNDGVTKDEKQAGAEGEKQAGAEGEEQGEGEQSPAKEKPVTVIEKFHPETASELANLLADALAGGLLKPTGRGYYEFTYHGALDKAPVVVTITAEVKPRE